MARKNCEAFSYRGPLHHSRFVDDIVPIQLTLASLKYTTALDGVAGSWCLQIHMESAIAHEVRRYADDLRAAGTSTAVKLPAFVDLI